MSTPRVLVWIGVAAVALGFIGIMLLPHPWGSIVGAFLSAAGIWLVGRAYAIHKRQQDEPRP